MPNLTTKELAGLSDQLDFERVLYSKYQTAVQETTDPVSYTHLESLQKTLYEKYLCPDFSVGQRYFC